MEFDDSLAKPVSAETVAHCQAYVLFYKKKPTKEMEDFRRHIENLMQQEMDAQSSNMRQRKCERVNITNNFLILNIP